MLFSGFFISIIQTIIRYSLNNIISIDHEISEGTSGKYSMGMLNVSAGFGLETFPHNTNRN